MILFLIKKAFFDTWDNLISVFLMNIGFMLVLAGAIYLPSLISFSELLFYLSLLVSITAFFLYYSLVAMAAKDIVNYRNVSFKSFFTPLRQIWPAAFVFSGVTSLIVVVVLVAFPFYSSVGGFAGLAAMALLFWVTVIWLVASQYFFPIRCQLDTNLKKVLRKSFIMFFDNTGFSLFLAVYSLVVLVLSGFTAFLLPGIGALVVLHQVAMKLRLLKYDYLEENPEANRKKIPWDALLIDEKDRVGPRTLRGMIFPWKE